MAKCSRCGKSGFLLKLSNGLCKSCATATKSAPKKLTPYEPIAKTRAIYVEIVPSDPTITDKSYIYSLQCVLDGDRVRLDRSSNTPIGYLPDDIGALAMRGHVQSVHFDGFIANDESDNRVPLRIKLRIWLVPSGGAIPAPPPDPLDVERGSKWIYPKVIDDCSIEYWYPSLPVSNVDRDKLREMLIAKKHQPQIEISQDGRVFLTYVGAMVAILQDKQDMCTDWLKKNLPLVCQFSSFEKNNEKVALAFYKDSRQRYDDYNTAVVELTAFNNEDAQFTISEMESTERLKVDKYEGFVMDIYNNEIGKLPAKYRRLCEDDAVKAIYFDHYEVSLNKDFEDIYIPFVKIYYNSDDVRIEGPLDKHGPSLNKKLADANRKSKSTETVRGERQERIKE